MLGDPEKKHNRRERRRLKKLNAPPLNKPAAPFYIDRDGQEFSNKEYMNTFGTGKYTQSVLDKDMNKKSNNKKRRVTKSRKRN